MSFESQSNTSFEKVPEKTETLKLITEKCDRYDLKFDPEKLTKLSTLPPESLQNILREFDMLDSNMKNISMWETKLHANALNGNPVII